MPNLKLTFGPYMAVKQPTETGNTKWIWPFELLEQIGEGGMGVVYRARYVVNDRQVALKMLPPDVNDKTTLARFERELEVLKNLKHRHIVRCFGGSCENKRRFYAMELIEGGTLEDKLEERGKLEWEQIVQYGLQMCSALHASHQAGVVHRDVKPSNFLITPDGHLKLSDFGLASVNAASKITAAGKTAGTFLYMAPEQIRGEEVTPSTDLYALGCVLYELVTGAPPFKGATPAATLHLHCHGEVTRPTETAFNCPATLEKLILQLLEKKPENRPSSAAEAGKLLKGVNQTITVVEPRRGSEFESSSVKLRADKKPAESAAPRTSGPVISRWKVMVLVALLAVSTMANATMFFTPSSSNKWRERWGEAAKSSHVQVRVEAIHAMSEMVSSDPHSLDGLLVGVEDPEPIVRIAALQGLRDSGDLAKEHIPTLMSIQKNDLDASVRTAAVDAVEVIKNAEPSVDFPWFGVVFSTLLLAVSGVAVMMWYQAKEEALQELPTPSTQLFS